MHPHLSKEAIVLDVETTRYGRTSAGRRGKITHVDKDPSTGGPIALCRDIGPMLLPPRLAGACRAFRSLRRYA
jgi:hypothetical protein